MVTAMDDLIGSMIKDLKSKGMYEDSVIIFSSDNGGPTQFGNMSSIQWARPLMVSRARCAMLRTHVLYGAPSVCCRTIQSVGWECHTLQIPCR